MKQYMSKTFRNFERDERGSLSVFMGIMLSSMLVVGGSAIDIVRHETVRSSLQYNLDRAVLAAASLRQSGDEAAAAAIINDYMSKVPTLVGYQATIDPDKTNITLTGRTVSAYATAELDTFFLGLVGFNTLDVRVSSTASEKIPNLEISMVLDVSGSMSGTKISRLKVAANKFVDTVIKDPSVVAEDNTVTTISIVPYSTNVTLPEEMFDLYTTEELHNDHQCVFFNADEFASVGLPTDVELKQLSSYAFSREYDSTLITVTDCKTKEYSKILPFSTSPTTLKNKINSLQAGGWTATHIGTRWGAALLERGAAPIANALGSADAAGHPKDFNEPGVLKALIVMSDGNNTHHRRLKDAYRSGGSNIYTVTNSSGVAYFLERNGQYREVRYWGQPYNDFYPSQGSPSSNSYWVNSLPDETQTQIIKQLTWAETWKRMTISDYSQISGINKNNIYGNVSSAADADAAMLATCTAAKANDQMVVYTIYFGDANTGNNGPSNAETLLKNCASGPGQFYNVTALDIEAAFSSIAISVQKLKLTQ